MAAVQEGFVGKTMINGVKRSLTKYTKQLGATAANWSVVLVYWRMRGIPRALGCIAYLSVWREVGALCVERLAVFVPSLPTLCFPLCISVTGAHSSRGRGGSWLGC